MDLFIINRYNDTNDDTHIIEQEAKRLEQLKQRIEERRKAFSVKKSSDVITLKEEKQTEILPDLPVSTNDDLSTEIPKPNTPPKPKEKISAEKQKEFKVLGSSDFQKKSKVQRILPYWLSHPTVVSRDLNELSCPVEEQEWLHPVIKSTLLSEGITKLFPVQNQVVPFILNEHTLPKLFQPRDVCVSAPTGSGKTLSFVIPIVQLLMKDVGCKIRALVVLPVQELAAQVAKVFKKYCNRTHLKVALLSGSVPFQQEQQEVVRFTESVGWVSKVEIIVCTAGRLVEHLKTTEGFNLQHLKFLVIDEADRIMDNIQNDWLYHVDHHIKQGSELMTGKVQSLNWKNVSKQKLAPQKLLFSATLSQDPEKLEQWGLFQPKLFSAATNECFEDEDQIRKYATPAELKEHYVVCEAENKPLVLYNFLVEQKWDKVLCFTNAAETTHRLTVLLNTWACKGLKVAELSAALDRTMRENVLKKFMLSEIDVLISTDALARGIDIPDCNYVISYDPPRNIKTYIHRVGRTGRAGKIGKAVTVLLPSQISLFKDLIKAGGKEEIPEIKINTDVIDRLFESYASAMNTTREKINSELNLKIKNSIEIKRSAKSKIKKRKK
ncbi:probable ATP-dependent RNA helicase Dbp73D [Bombyx mandarina]|uniref:ATP-dependent RNA helicase n=1 Tax=Bombyx mandarina TaxID=7092 RepID=A0A6J2K4B6_BOMMA|nr:probable ATP-dependent RNA helicase Dbp73D [Bombyx mandarina]